MFYWIGVVTCFIGAAALGGVLALAVTWLWQSYGPEFICRRPTAINVWSMYRGDVRFSEGGRVKCGDDMRITRIIGIAWRFRWLFGIVTFAKDDGK